MVLALDTYSCGLPATVAAKLCGTLIMLRTGGDFLWEQYVERTDDLVLLRDFYKEKTHPLSSKEQAIFRLTGWVLRNVDAVVWSTHWQKDIFEKPYRLEEQRHFIIENYYGTKIPSHDPHEKSFAAGTRKLKWKNVALLEKAFADESVKALGVRLDTETLPHDDFIDKLGRSYAVLIASLGDISPNTILDAIRLDKPFILTRENGLADRIKDIALFVDPLNLEDIKEKILWLSEPANYALQKERVASFSFTHTWEEMAGEYVAIYKKIK
jgi:glycosyltransferase involved in cell wall biosynthesis